MSVVTLSGVNLIVLKLSAALNRLLGIKAQAVVVYKRLFSSRPILL